MANKQGTKVFIYEDGRKLYGTIEHDDGVHYTIKWSDGDRTKELIAEFSPAGWVQ